MPSFILVHVLDIDCPAQVSGKVEKKSNYRLTFLCPEQVSGETVMVGYAEFEGFPQTSSSPLLFG